jgi:hypothetical protein
LKKKKYEKIDFCNKERKREKDGSYVDKSSLER